jgi:hypothetical protein
MVVSRLVLIHHVNATTAVLFPPYLTLLHVIDLAGYLIDGTEFDSSYKRNKPTTFAPNQVIKGWTEAMQVLS